MIIQIGNHKIEYNWDDGLERQLDGSSKENIVGAINRRYTRGKLLQDGVWCNWEDVTDDDVMLFGITQGWFD
jgi:hypothetical protein